MKISHYLLERRAYGDVLYHYTDPIAVSEILAGDEFVLKSSYGNKRERSMTTTKAPFYLSTTRHKLGGFHVGATGYGAMLNLDGEALSLNHVIKPVDFWRTGHDKYTTVDDRESEDRVLSRTASIKHATSYIKSIHLLLQVGTRLNPQTVVGFRRTVLAAKLKQIPVYWYDSPRAFLLQRGDIPIPMENLKSTGVVLGKPYLDRPAAFSAAVLELMHKPVGTPLSKMATDTLKMVLDPDRESPLSNVFSYKPSGRTAIALSTLSARLGLRSTTDIRDWIANKWKKTT